MLTDDTDSYHAISSTMPMLTHNIAIYDTSYSTMPILPDNVAMARAVREELL